jgi:dTDP-4-amino-4,6-dideoxygalactose transaminase
VSAAARRLVGGEFEISLEELLAPGDPRELPAAAFATGRGALRALAATLEGPVLLPSYCCASMVSPFAAEGVEVRFYDVGPRLELGGDALVKAADDEHAAAIVFVDYFGFPPRPEDEAALRSLRDRCVVVEDRSHGAPDAAPIGTDVVASLRKHLPLPDGATWAGPRAVQPPAGDRRFARVRALAQALRHEFVAGGDPALEPAYLALFAAAEDVADTTAAISDVSLRLLGRFDLAAAADRRRRNFGLLLERFDDRLGEPLFPELPGGVSPLVFPFVVRGKRRDALRAALRERGVFCPVHWPLPAEVDRTRHPASAELSATILGVPIDHRYDDADVEWVAQQLAELA